ncbi:hypothetical protein VNI00_010575 [Paramarasmius palmivorus]|uniref:Fungal-type protein kinase domain-containing protein n=1 Tax=Paramarasmius palmivorus TaxID=297713 RepID=A0AAW0CIN2_9AGAR
MASTSHRSISSPEPNEQDFAESGTVSRSASSFAELLHDYPAGPPAGAAGRIGEDTMHMSSFNSTPHQRGAADHFTGDEQPTHNDFAPFLRYDLRYERVVNLDKFIQHVLHIEVTPQEEQVLQSIAASEEFDRRLGLYCEQVAGEEGRYSLFAGILNYAISRLVEEGVTTNDLGLIAHVNDPGVIVGSMSKRKPDVCFLRALSVYGRLGITMLGGGPATEEDRAKLAEAVVKKPEVAFSWSDLLGWAELKLRDNKIDREKLRKAAERKAEMDSKSKKSTKPAPNKSKSSKGSQKSTPLPLLIPGLTKVAQSNTPATVSSGGSGSKRVRSDSSDESVPPPKRPARQVNNFILPEGVLQCASYALEMFNHGAIRTHTIGALSTDDSMRLLLYTRSGTCRTEPFSFIQDPFKLLVIVLALTRLSLPQWGILEILPPRNLLEYRKPRPYPDTRVFMTANGDRYFTLGDFKFKVLEVQVFPRGLLGRGTWTILLERDDGTTWILKLSSQVATRVPEWCFLDRVKKVVEQNNEHKWILDHLPTVLIHEDIELDVVDFKALFGSDGNLDDVEYEPRVMRAIVYERLYPIHSLPLPGLLMNVYLDTVKTHEWLVKHAKILHRDISVGNLMYRVKSDSTIVGVLNDYDLARFVDEKDPKPSSQHRTGTKPFVALDLLSGKSNEPTDHFVRHDLESFFYVFAWITCRFHRGVEILNPPLTNWATGAWEDVLQDKTLFFLATSKGLLDDWKKMWDDALWDWENYLKAKKASSMNDETDAYDKETLGGRIDYQKIYDLFERHHLEVEDLAPYGGGQAATPEPEVEAEGEADNDN